MIPFQDGEGQWCRLRKIKEEGRQSGTKVEESKESEETIPNIREFLLNIPKVLF